ncbi:MAG TPA: DUF222 domain-containing protein [Acidimicrobiales bacterium]|nr:DUF222 domain-containing protein [Acidimicrobiales bacterium]
MCQKLSGLREAMGVYAAGFDPALISASDAGLVVEHASAIERMAATVKALAAARVSETSLWRKDGDGSPAQALARKTGTSIGAAAAAIKTGKRLKKQPKVAAAARQGELSPEQASAISEAAEANPNAETKLLEKARGASLAELKDECGRVKAAADENADARHRRIHRSRFLRRYTDAEGAGNIHVRNNVEMVAAVMSVLQPIADQLQTEAKASGREESAEAYAADALNELARMAAMGDVGDWDDDDEAGRVTPGGEGPAPGAAAQGVGGTRRAAGPVPPGKTATRRTRRWYNARLLGRFDVEAFVRGYPIEGEMVELVGYGPIPVAAMRDMIESGNPFLVAIATKGVDVVSVAHIGRKFTAHQHSALDWLYPTCAAKGCGKPAQETDHRADWSKTHVSLLTQADRYCSRHHYLKTHHGWGLVEGTGVREFVPPEDPRHPANSPPRVA